MTFSLQTVVAPQKRLPGIFSHTRKHVARRSRMSERGSRFYNPSLGRWLNRDPMEEPGGRNLYEYVHNDPIGGLDFAGLWVIDRNGADRADATAESGDTVDTLAPLVGLSASEFDAWLTSATRPMPSSSSEVLCGTYEIPNKVLILGGHIDFWIWGFHVHIANMRHSVESLGYKA
jgi:RHS repeat-associated protein